MNSKHVYTVAGYEIKTGGFRGVILNQTTRERKTSDVLATLSAAKCWAQKAAFEALPDGGFTFAPIRIRGEYRANVWVAA